MDSKEYLSRIEYTGPADPTTETLTSLHLAHMYSVPFENLDIPLGVPIELDFERLFKKVVGRNRGGFCYELNGLFGWLLTSLGFEVEMLSARVYGADGEPGEEFDHMLLRVNKDYIADVGFGDSFTVPLKFEKGRQSQETGDFRLTGNGPVWLLERGSDDGWKSQYVFTETPRAFGEYEQMCRHQQTSSDSIFTQKILCSMATARGRVTYANGRVIETKAGEKSEWTIDNTAQLRALFEERFGFEIEGDCEKLLGTTRSVSK